MLISNSIQNIVLHILGNNTVTQDPFVGLIAWIVLRTLALNLLRLTTTQLLVLAIAFFPYISPCFYAV